MGRILTGSPSRCKNSRSLVIPDRREVSMAKKTRKYILDESTHFKPSSNIMFYADNAGTMARIFTGSPSRRKNTRRPVIANRHSICRAEETRKYILDESTHSKPPSNIIFHADNSGTMARIFTGSPSRGKNTRRLVITYRRSISRAEETRKYILDESTHSKPSSNIIFYADNAGTMARIFTGSPSRRKNTRRPVIANRHSICRAEETRKYILDESTHSKPSSNIIFHADNSGTMARFFKGSPDRCKNTRGPVISRGG